MGMTVIEKILARATGQQRVELGDIVWATPDLTIAHDLNYTRYREMMDQMGVAKMANPEKLLLTIDHLPYSDEEKSAAIHARMRNDFRNEGIGHFFDLGRHGVSHNIPIDHGIVLPGMLVITSDTRSPALGCVGAVGIALGAGLLTTMVSGKAWLRVPPTIRVNLSGHMRKGVMSRDVGEWIANKIGPDRADYRSIEFAGSAMADMPIDARHTLCNAMVDIGVKAAIALPDAVTRAYVESFGGKFQPVLPDADAQYEEIFEFNIDQLEPQISLPPDPENVRPISELVGQRIDQAFVGSCIGGKMEDLRAAAQVLRGHKVRDGVRFLIIPASQKIYDEAVREGLIEVFSAANCYVAVGACGPCYGSIAPLSGSEVCIGTSTRNEPGRMGSSKATIYIANAAAVAASAVRGVITDPRDFLN
jgi:3-isopropylmalate/(R)-2-methylmalate dehydratase large subunit